MRVLVICGFDFGQGSGWWGTDLPPNILDLESGKTVGGGEEAALRGAEGLKKLGHEVLLYWYGRPGTWRGVEFRSLQHDLYVTLVSGKWDAVVSFSALQPLEWAPEGAVRIFAQQLNDLFPQGDWSRVDCIVSPSESHAQQLPFWGWKKRPYAVVHNGLDGWMYGQNNGNPKGVWGEDMPNKGNIPPPWESRPLNVGYWNSPDRGLHHVLRAWPKVRDIVPEARLHLFYELDRFLLVATAAVGYHGDRARVLNHLVAKAKADPSIIFHGSVPRNQLRKTQFQTRVMCYPLSRVSYVEGFCGSVNQGIAAGCHVMACPQDALPSLYGGACTWLPNEPDVLDEVLPDYIVRGLTDEAWSLAQVHKAEPHRFNFTWERAAKELEAAILRKNWGVTRAE